jgi:hypothetical protein
MKKIILILVLLVNVFSFNLQYVNAAPNYCGNDRKGLPPLVICGRSGSGACTEQCEIKHVGMFLNNLVYLIMYLMFLLLPLYIIYIGIEIIRAQGKPEALTHAKDAAFRIVVSLILFLLAWLIVYTITVVLGVRQNIPSFLIKDGQQQNSFLLNNGTPAR